MTNPEIKKDSESKPKKFLFWKKKERKKPETFTEKVIEFFRQLFWAAIAAFFIGIFTLPIPCNTPLNTVDIPLKKIEIPPNSNKYITVTSDSE